ncbi:hypothetical protein BDZ91DRAFT_804133 [Kalaharituber pfeilii]|nr:hypothetical protein BDZ91DRAFT_804133 [Kalaharituber pfeilii]
MREAPTNRRATFPKTSTSSKHKATDSIPRARTLPAYLADPNAPRRQYWQPSAAENANTLGSLSTFIFGIATGLAPLLPSTSFPGFCRVSHGKSEAAKQLERHLPDYQAAFQAPQGETHTKPSAIAAIISAFVWDCIQEYSIFTKDAALDLKGISKLRYPGRGKGKRQPTMDEELEEIYAARMVLVHGYGEPPQPNSPQENMALLQFQSLYKHLFPLGDDEGRRQIWLLAREVWKLSMQLRNQKGELEISFSPFSTATYHNRLKKGEIQEILYYDITTGERSTPPPQPPTKTKASGPILWFPEVVLYRQQTRNDDKDTALVFKPKYSPDLDTLIERERSLESHRSEVAKKRSKSDLDKITPVVEGVALAQSHSSKIESYPAPSHVENKHDSKKQPRHPERSVTINDKNKPTTSSSRTTSNQQRTPPRKLSFWQKLLQLLFGRKSSDSRPTRSQTDPGYKTKTGQKKRSKTY